MGDEVGFPLFLKTSFTAAKHYWRESCFMPNAQPQTVLRHLAELCMYQSMSPHPYSPSLVVREMIKTAPAFIAFDGGMPVTKEFRVFSDSGKVSGYQPYWPELSIQKPSIEGWREALVGIKEPSAQQLAEMVETAKAVTEKLGGYWSVDFLADKDGQLWLIDMAEGNLSYRNEQDFVQLDTAPARKAFESDSPTP